ncbi:MarR family transcriptional regulator [Sphingomonas sp.]|uniref:MarR family winged helix-turn-helix transcriptional regulator n=1 Tax=Sphingomonas sp. TaxID=28214 RepID=UPI000DB48619|nr:MarR family transcriptional regulator [Sphingomonas sp.]PZU08165.1 MAG: MarR family transcriptional regulator [Sphingomonas sp.]
MTYDRPALEAAYARTLLPLARMWRQAADKALREMSLSASVGWALVQLSRLDDNVRQTDLAAELDITAASLVRLIDQMAASGLVERRRDDNDARVSRVGLTTRGAAVAATIEQKLAALRNKMLHDMPDADLETALDVAQRLAARFVQERKR